MKELELFLRQRGYASSFGVFFGAFYGPYRPFSSGNRTRTPSHNVIRYSLDGATFSHDAFNLQINPSRFTLYYISNLYQPPIPSSPLLLLIIDTKSKRNEITCFAPQSKSNLPTALTNKSELSQCQDTFMEKITQSIVPRIMSGKCIIQAPRIRISSPRGVLLGSSLIVSSPILPPLPLFLRFSSPHPISTPLHPTSIPFLPSRSQHLLTSTSRRSPRIHPPKSRRTLR
jgi:hypothetical protein